MSVTSLEYKPSSPSSDETLSEPPPSSLKPLETSPRTPMRLLPFRPTALVRPVPSIHASLADKLQWLALERPNVIHVVEKLVEGVIAKCRQPFALRVELTDNLEYRDIIVHDPSVLMAPLAVQRIGRRLTDIVTPDYAELIDRTIYLARTTGTGQSYRYKQPHGSDVLHGIIHIVRPDLIAIDISKGR